MSCRVSASGDGQPSACCSLDLKVGPTRGATLCFLLAAIVAVMPACASKTAPPPAVVTERFPDFVVPAAPGGLGTTATIERHKAGWQWLQAGDLRAADRNFTAALKLSPAFYPAEAGLGYAALARKDHDAALQHFDRAVVANPRYAPALAGRGDALLAAGQREEALQSFEAAVAADSTLTSLSSRIDVLRLRVLQDNVAAARKAAEGGKLSEARQMYQQAIAASPQSPFLYRELAVVDRQDNDLAAALVHAQKAVTLDPSDPRALTLTGEILEARGDIAAALASFTAALALEPNDTLAARIEDLRARAAVAALPAEFQSIETDATVTRAQLAALIGVRLEPLFKRLDRTTAVVITDTRTNWASPWILSVARAGVMEVYANHTFQPSEIARREDLARAASRVLALVADEKPALGARWRDAARPRFPDVPQGHLSYPAVSLVVEAGVMTAAEDGSFQLTRPVTGAEAVAAVKKLEDLAIIRAR
jgi:tetratricopeptide (TPR) repeat protein